MSVSIPGGEIAPKRLKTGQTPQWSTFVASCHVSQDVANEAFFSKPGSFPGWNPAIVGAEQNNTPQLHDLMAHESPKWQVLQP